MFLVTIAGHVLRCSVSVMDKPSMIELYWQHHCEIAVHNVSSVSRWTEILVIGHLRLLWLNYPTCILLFCCGDAIEILSRS